MAESSRLDELRRRVQHDPASIAFAALAEEYRRARRYRDAVDTSRAGLRHHPGYISARVTLGRSLIEMHDYEPAERELAVVLRSAPDNLAARRAMGELCWQQLRFADALHHYRTALALVPRDTDLPGIVDALEKELEAEAEAEAAEAAEAAMATERLVSAEPLEPTEPTEPAESAELAVSAEPADLVEPAEQAELAESVAIAEPVGFANPVELADVLDTTPGVDAASAVDAAPRVDAEPAVDEASALEAAPAVDAADAVGAEAVVDAPDPVEAVASAEVAEAFEAPAEPLEAFEPLEMLAESPPEGLEESVEFTLADEAFLGDAGGAELPVVSASLEPVTAADMVQVLVEVRGLVALERLHASLRHEQAMRQDARVPRRAMSA